MRDRARQCRVVIGVGLRARTGEIEMQLVAVLPHRAVQLLGDRFAGFTIEGGDILTRHPCTVRHRAELGAGFRFRIFDHLGAGPLNELEAKFINKPEIALGANIIPGNHRLQIEPNILGIAAHGDCKVIVDEPDP